MQLKLLKYDLQFTYKPDVLSRLSEPNQSKVPLINVTKDIKMITAIQDFELQRILKLTNENKFYPH